MNNQTDKQMDNQKSDHITGQMQDIIEEDHKKSIMIHENVTKKINDFPNNKSCEENNSPKHITNVKKSILIKNTKKRDGQVFYHKHIYEKNKGHLYNLRNEKINDTPIIEKNKNKKIDSDNESLILIKHNKGSCNPCANYFFHFSGCSKGNQCTKCHHDYHKNHEDPLHPSQLLHKKNICVPCENYFKKQCKRSMPVCIYCHDDSHKKEYTAAGKINELTNDKNQILYVKTHLYINQQEHVREMCHPCEYYFTNYKTCFNKYNCNKCHHKDHADIQSFYHPSNFLHYKNKCSPCKDYIEGSCKKFSHQCIYCHNHDHLKEDMDKKKKKNKRRKVKGGGNINGN
ncbi:hypothetical protein PFBG_00919 [Plasmodium falciparum 7G8]|uniref:Uncharacterized protein n=1 Tax=Plasmodium falciparum (isolate 7G8) TaxID=57266 RepID=W7FSL9_PLAF8|nr:hypothetical protein PFBG_00919 [Plasmodium falciparum 7G8]